MSNVIEDRVLQMKFDNDNFEKNVKQSLFSLEALNKSLDNTESNGGMVKLAEGADITSSKFGALELVAIGFLTRLGAKAADVGMSMAKSLSIDQITAGWDKYASKTESVQTIMAATESTWKENAEQIGFTGTQMEFVSEQLQRLNWFSDETSYSFSDMTNNIGKFTSNGVALTDAVEAMEGISTWAALSGQNTMSASRAMYNLAQAMSTGSVKLIDWKSIENANMATAEFKQTAIDTALALGTLQQAEDGTITTLEGNEVSVTKFNQALSDGWFSSEVLMKSLSKYGNFAVRLGEICDDYGVTASQFLKSMDDYKNGSTTATDIIEDLGIEITESDLISLFDELGDSAYTLGNKSFRAAQEAKTFAEAIAATKDAVSTYWMNIFETLFGNYEKAKVFWTDVTNWLWDVFAAPLDNLQTILGEWDENGGQLRFTKSLYNLMDIVTKVVDIVKEAFHDIFPEKTSQDLVNWTRQFMILTNNILKADDVFENIKRTLRGFFAIIDIGLSIGKAVFSIFKSVFDQILPASKGILNITGNIGDFLVSISEAIKNSEKFKEVIESISGKVSKLVDFFKNLVKVIGDFISNITNGAFDNISKDLSEHVHFLDIIKNIAEKLAPVFSKIGLGIAKFVNAAVSKLGELFGNFSFDRVMELLDQGFLAAIFIWIKKFLASNSLTTFAEILKDSFTGMADSITGALGSLTKKLDAEALRSIAISIAILAGSLIVLSMVDQDKLIMAVGTITGLLFELYGIMNLMAGADSKGFKDALTGIMDSFSFKTKMKGLEKLAIAIGILALSVKILSTIEPEQLILSVGALSLLVYEMVAVCKALSNNEKKMLKGAGAMIPFAIGMVIMAAACKIFATMSWEELAISMLAFTTIVGTIVGMSIALEKTGSSSALVKAGAGLIPFAVGIVILGAAMKIFATMSWEELAKGAASLIVVLGTITGMTIALNKVAGNGALAAVGAGLILFAAGVVILGAAMKIFATMSWEELAKGAASLIVVLGTITGMTIALNKVAGNGALAAVGAGLILFAAGVVILGAAMKIFAEMSFADLAKGLVAFATGLGIITGMTIALSKVAGKGALAAVGAGLILLAIGLRIMTPALQALGALSWGSLAKAGVALAGLFAILGVAAKILEPLIPTIIKLAGALALMGLACVLVGAGLLMVGTGLAAVGGSLMVIGAGVLNFVTSILTIIPTVIKIIAAFLEGLLTTIINLIGNYAPELLKAAVILIETFCESLLQAAPTIFDTIVQMLDMLINYVPQIVEKVSVMVIKIIESLADKIPDFVKAIAKFIQKLFGAVGELLGGLSLTDLTLALAELAGATLMLAFVGKMGAAAIKGAVIMLGVVAIMGALLAGLGALVTYVPEIQTFLQNGIPILEQIGFALGSFFGNIVSGLMTGLTTGLPEIATNLSLFMTNLQPFLDGINTVSPDAGAAALSLAEAILALTAANLIDSIASFITGESSLAKFAEQIVPFGAAMAEFSATVDGKINESAVESASNAGKMLAEMAKTLPNSGGVAGFFAGENDLDVFAAKIVPFGEAIAEFSATVDGKVNESAVQSAANAGKMLAEMASTLPNSGGVVGFFAGENDLDTFAAKIVPFGKAIADFSSKVNGKVDESAVEAAASAGKMMAEMASTIPNSGGVVSWFVGENDMEEFASKLKPFGTAMADFSAEVSGKVDPAAVTAAANAGKAIAEMASTIPNEGGIVSWFTGDNDLTKFAENLKPFGTAMADFSKEVSGKIDADDVTAAANAGKMIAEMAATIPNDGGVLGFFAGNNDFAEFSVNMSSFGTGIKEFSDSVKEQVDTEAVETATSAGMKIIDFAKAIPNDGGVLGFFTGNNDMGEFASQFSTFGDAIKTFSNTVKNNVDTEAVEIATAAGMKIVDFASAIPNDGGALGFFAGNNDMATFSEQFTAFGGAIAEFSTAVEGKVNTEAVDIATTAGKSISSLAEAVKGKTGNLSKFADDITKLGPALSDYAASVATVNTDDISKAATGMDSLIELLNNISANAGASAKTFADALNELANSGIDKFVQAFDDAVPTVKDTVGNLMDEIIENVKGLDGDFYDAANSVISKLVDAIDDNEQPSIDAVTRIVTTAASTMESFYGNFYDAGSYNMHGYINGMNSQYNAVYQAAYSLGETAYNAAMAATDSHSPSKKFEQAGSYNGIGYANGMRKTLGIVGDAANDMGDVSLDTIQGIISDISRMVESDMDCNPTIRPVLDASDIQNGLSDLSRSVYGGSFMVGATSGKLSRNMDFSSKSSGGVTNNYQTPTYNTYNIDGVTYSAGTEVSDAVSALISAIRMERRM